MNLDNEIEQSEKLASHEAEQSVIGTILKDGTIFDDAAEIVCADDFFFRKNRELFMCIKSLADEQHAVDVITVAEKLQATTGNADLEYISDLATNASGSNLKAYATIVRDKAIKRGILSASRIVQGEIYSRPDMSARDAIEIAQAAVMGLSDIGGNDLDDSDVDKALKKLFNDLDQKIKNGDLMDGLSSGLFNMDSKINGWKPGNLVIIAGRPSMGKTTYALQMALDMWWQQKKNGLFFSLEMSTDELMQKALACVGQIPLGDVIKPKNDFFGKYSAELHSAGHKLIGTSAKIIDCPGIHISQVKSYARKAHKRKPLDFLFVDHINIMDGDGTSPNHVVGSITKGLKHLAKELNIPVFGLAQLNRGVEQRQNKRPMMSDLRESGSMEQDADVIQLLYREDYYKEAGTGDAPNDGLLEINTAKFRNGERGPTYYEHRLDQSRVEDTSRTPIFNAAPTKTQRGF